MSPRASNRSALLEGALKSLQERGYADTTARDIATAASANLASIGYHFGSTEKLLTEALLEGSRRWLAQFTGALRQDPGRSPGQMLNAAAGALRDSLEQHKGFAIAFVEALARAPRSEPLRQALADSYEEGRQAVASMFATDSGSAGATQASVLIAVFDGLLIQWLLDPRCIPDGAELQHAIARLGHRAPENP